MIISKNNSLIRTTFSTKSFSKSDNLLQKSLIHVRNLTDKLDYKIIAYFLHQTQNWLEVTVGSIVKTKPQFNMIIDQLKLKQEIEFRFL